MYPQNYRTYAFYNRTEIYEASIFEIHLCLLHLSYTLRT